MALGRARLSIGHGISVWVLEAPDGFGDAAFHAHHAIQLTLCLGGSLRLTTEDDDRRGPALAVAADARHRFEAAGLLVFIFVEPESAAGRALGEKLFAGGRLAALDYDRTARAVAPLGRAIEGGLDSAGMIAAGQAVVDTLVPGGPAAPTDQRVLRIIEAASRNLDGPIRLADAAEGVHLSPSRVRHLFVEQTGLAFKTYVLWLRLTRALAVYAEGRSLTQAAHEAGFSDSAHLSRIFKRTFGLPATTLTRL